MQVNSGTLFLLSLVFCFAAMSAEPVLLLKGKSQKIELKRSELLKGASKITVKRDPVYEKEMVYFAVSISSLLKQVDTSKNSLVQFTADDGFSSVIARERLVSDVTGAKPYLAIESSKAPWPVIPKKGSSAGPFYLVWLLSSDATVRQEEWAYKIKSMEVISSLEDRYPKIIPKGSRTSLESVYKGYEVFVQNCFACHTMNKQGEATLGPDLNFPYSPTEYMKEKYLWKLIRNPQNLRHWEMSQMSAFPKAALSDAQIKDLIVYLKHMAKNKR